MRLVLLLPLVVAVLGTGCPREPNEEHSAALRSPGDNGFKVLISGEPDKYIPGAVYTLSIVGSRTHDKLQQFSRFLLSVEPLDAEADGSPQRVGSFQLFGDSLTTFNEGCINTISEADDLPKSEIQVMWIAPPKQSGCIVFRAMVLEDTKNWYADDGALSRTLCEVTTVQEDEPGEDKCCACDEAKYQLVFEGLWSNLTHPKDFPSSLWLTHFSDVIGASHERNFSFWDEGQLASDGLRQVAEWGSVGGMEAELRAQSKHLRTLIKAAGLWYPRVNSNTTSNFRVDRRRHLVSLVSMLGPSPDWIVGVSGLNLCQKDCTWAEEKVIDLYPYDSGTDSGITYMSPNTPTVPQERIHKITSMYPEDPRAPFYDAEGKPMHPIARFHFTREKVIHKSCEDLEQLLRDSIDTTENTEDTNRPECATGEYSEWSACSVSCGKGLRMRARTYMNPAKADMLGCDRQLVSKEMCVADLPSCPGDEDDDEPILEGTAEICETTPWGPWSECSVSCGIGQVTHTRRFLDRMGRKKCPHVTLMEKDKCMLPACQGPIKHEIVDPMCPVTAWSDWSPCSASCGKGVKFRTRLLLVGPELQEKCSNRLEVIQQRPCMDNADCQITRDDAKEVCMLEKEVGPCRGYFQRWLFDPVKEMCVPFGYGGCRGNRNNFLTAQECNDACGAVRDSLLESRVAQAQPEKDFVEPLESTVSLLSNQLHGGPIGQPVNCMVTNWSPWSDCNVSCGVGTKEKQRMIKVQPRNGGRPCPKRLVRKKKCQAQQLNCDE